MQTLRVAALALLTFAASLGAPGPRAAADTIDVGGTPLVPGQVYNCGDHYLLFQDAVANQPGYQTPQGVITSWSTMALAVNPGTMVLKVGREGPDDTYTITGSGPQQPLVAGRLNSFLTRIPVRAGDVLGLYTSTPSGCAVISGLPAGDVVRHASFTPDLGVGAVYVTDIPETGFRLNVSARVEPDADGDQYGDLTQDACPSLKNSHDDCIPPDTFLKSGPPKQVIVSGATATATIRFFASETGATFGCRVDKKAVKPCPGKLRTRVKTGKHTVRITATDKVGNVDPTPLVVRFTVRQRVG
jgi:hypothetical protein